MSDRDEAITAHDLLLSFSEWLDCEGLMVAPDDLPAVPDPRTHDDLASLFLASMDGTPIGEWAQRVSEP